MVQWRAARFPYLLALQTALRNADGNIPEGFGLPAHVRILCGSFGLRRSSAIGTRSPESRARALRRLNAHVRHIHFDGGMTSADKKVCRAFGGGRFDDAAVMRHVGAIRALMASLTA